MKHTDKINRLVRVKTREIIDGCLKCQDARKVNGLNACDEHADLIYDIFMYPRKHFKDLELPGDTTCK